MTDSIFPIVTLLFGGGITYYFSQLQTRKEAQRKYKEEKYALLLKLLQGFCGNMSSDTTKRAFFDEYYQAWVYASDDVIIAIKQLIDSVKIGSDEQDRKNGKAIIGNVVTAIRRDMGVKTNIPPETFEYIEVVSGYSKSEKKH